MDNASELTLKCCLRSYPYTDAIKAGNITIPGVKLDFVDVKPHIAAFRRMVRELEFDVCELAPTTYVIARAYGVPIKALPIFFVRRFHHDGLMVPENSAIKGPKDLAGKKVGVRAWSVTTGVWKRGILQNEYGVDPSQVTWVVDDEEHVEALKLPPYVQHAPDGKSIAGMFAAGEIDAGFTGDAGVGREGKPTSDWKAAEAKPSQALRDVFAGEKGAERDFFNRTGVFPMHGTLAVREDLLDAHPDLAHKLYNAFVAARAPYIEDLKAGRATGEQAEKDKKLIPIVGDPLPYGIEANRTSIEGLIRYAHQQGLIPKSYSAEQMFVAL
jgi:4,5-dihydroxyphthalate decarboxylase